MFSFSRRILFLSFIGSFPMILDENLLIDIYFRIDYLLGQRVFPFGANCVRLMAVRVVV